MRNKEQMYTTGFRLQDIPTVFLTSSRPTVGSCASHLKAFALHPHESPRLRTAGALKAFYENMSEMDILLSVWDGNFGCLLLAAHTLTPVRHQHSLPKSVWIRPQRPLGSVSERWAAIEPHAAERAHADPADAITLPN
ncbi:hypothetical protein B0H14DRAFT_2575483 [Mycena olivaceomarginata]|nr:hypothetical protein B0H14DRAFT_2575483 [Mycena olivaceomarginata]